MEISKDAVGTPNFRASQELAANPHASPVTNDIDISYMIEEQSKANLNERQ